MSKPEIVVTKDPLVQAGRKVRSARLHQSIYLEGWGELGNTLPPMNKVIAGLVMTLTDSDSLQITGSYNGIKATGLIPSANIVAMRLENES